MPKPTINRNAIARQVEEIFTRNRALYGDFRMEATGESGDGSSESGGSADGGQETAPRTLEDVIADLGLTPEQIAGRLEASKKWEQRAKSTDRVDRADYDRVVQERNALQQQHETEQEKAVREAKEAGAAEARQGSATDTAKALLRLAIRARKNDITDDDLAEIVAVTNLSAFVAGDGVDEAKILAHASRSVGTTDGKGPDMGQGNRGNQSQESGVAAGRSMFAASRGGKTP